MNKRGLSDIVLVILLLLVFALFIVMVYRIFVEKSFTTTLRATPREIPKRIILEDLTDEQKSRALAYCEAACDAVGDEASAVEFCSATVNLSDEPPIKIAYRMGGYATCISKVPCFIVVPQCQNGKYTPFDCRTLLFSKPQYVEKYYNLIRDVDSNSSTPSDGCNLPTDDATNKKPQSDESGSWKVPFLAVPPNYWT